MSLVSVVGIAGMVLSLVVIALKLCITPRPADYMPPEIVHRCWHRGPFAFDSFFRALKPMDHVAAYCMSSCSDGPHLVTHAAGMHMSEHEIMKPTDLSCAGPATCRRRLSPSSMRCSPSAARSTGSGDMLFNLHSHVQHALPHALISALLLQPFASRSVH